MSAPSEIPRPEQNQDNKATFDMIGLDMSIHSDFHQSEQNEDNNITPSKRVRFAEESPDAASKSILNMQSQNNSN